MRCRPNISTSIEQSGFSGPGDGDGSGDAAMAGMSEARSGEPAVSARTRSLREHVSKVATTSCSAPASCESREGGDGGR
eukprot:5021649-Prymnesium_polylepis.1